MNFNEAEIDIRQFFNTAWIAAFPLGTPPIAWPDIEFTIPTDKTWIRFTCQENDGQQVSMGSPNANRFRQYGVIILQIFQPQGQGSKDARVKAAAALSAFKGAVTTNGVHFYDVYGRQIGNDGKGFEQINVVSSFYYDEIT